MKLSEMRNLTQKIPEPKYHFDSANMMEHVKLLGLDTSVFHRNLEMDSPFVDAYRDITYSNDDVQLHSHTFFEILYCRSANGTEYLIGPHRYKLQNGDLIFVPPGVSHRPILPNNMPEPYVRDVMWVNADFMGSLYRDGYLQESLLLRTAGTKWEYLEELFGVAVWESENTPTDWDIAVLGTTFCLLSHLRRAFQDTDDHQTMAEKSELLDQVLAYIEAHFSERVTLADVARHFFVSESTITQLFRKKMGVSFYRCVTQRRLIAAKGLIAQGLPMDTVGEQVGFADYSSFFRAFKQEYGISPSQFKKTRTSGS